MTLSVRPAADPYARAVTRAIDALHGYEVLPSIEQFNATSQQLADALTIGLQLVGGVQTPGPAIVAQLRAEYG
ncbi:hypothetical protein [Mycobacteroides abscessus]|uniref:hypothetical protein n=1 Tax=Mycobacteroides abscessus TaxID=36809 RepID=UPI0019D13A59|nr:hypothetical protein [Mycobacteroides abscessus]QSN49790.1 hypothetical protein I3U33_27045 [Mycobacteroides abscessus subsp. abscessus]